MTKPRLVIAVGAIGCYLAAVILANWLTTRYGFVPVGFGYQATAGTFAAGGALVVRDVVQDAFGPNRWRRYIGTVVVVLLAAALSFLVADPAIALASGAAFLVAESLDMAAYTPLRERGPFGGGWWRGGVTAGAVLGSVADTIVFLTIAFGWAAVGPTLPGQLLGKLEVAAVLIVAGTVSRALLRESLDTRSA